MKIKVKIWMVGKFTKENCKIATLTLNSGYLPESLLECKCSNQPYVWVTCYVIINLFS